MDAEIKRLWVEALRSGKYEQGREQLRSGDKFCCLGVLCDLVKDRVGGNWRDDGETFACGVYQGGWSTSDLPDAVRECVGLESSDPAVEGVCLSRVNDGDFNLGTGKLERGQTFPQIADLIERHL